MYSDRERERAKGEYIVTERERAKGTYIVTERERARKGHTYTVYRYRYIVSDTKEKR